MSYVLIGPEGLSVLALPSDEWHPVSLLAARGYSRVVTIKRCDKWYFSIIMLMCDTCIPHHGSICENLNVVIFLKGQCIHCLIVAIYVFKNSFCISLLCINELPEQIA